MRSPGPERASRLVHGPCGKLWTAVPGASAEGLLVLGQMLPQHVPKGLGLLRAEEDALVAMVTWSGGLVEGQAEDQLEVPDAGADLDAVGVDSR